MIVIKPFVIAFGAVLLLNSCGGGAYDSHDAKRMISGAQPNLRTMVTKIIVYKVPHGSHPWAPSIMELKNKAKFEIIEKKKISKFFSMLEEEKLARAAVDLIVASDASQLKVDKERPIYLFYFFIGDDSCGTARLEYTQSSIGSIVCLNRLYWIKNHKKFIESVERVSKSSE